LVSALLFGKPVASHERPPMLRSVFLHQIDEARAEIWRPPRGPPSAVATTSGPRSEDPLARRLTDSNWDSDVAIGLISFNENERVLSTGGLGSSHGTLQVLRSRDRPVAGL
jgi:hypothetical protein